MNWQHTKIQTNKHVMQLSKTNPSDCPSVCICCQPPTGVKCYAASIVFDSLEIVEMASFPFQLQPPAMMREPDSVYQKEKNILYYFIKRIFIILRVSESLNIYAMGCCGLCIVRPTRAFP